MNAMLFLVRKQIKNYIKDIIHHPSKLVLYIFFVGMMVLMFVSISKDPPKSEDYIDIRVLHGIFLAWLLFMAVPNVLSAVKKGSVFFKMSDVNFLFVSPVSSKQILAYGLAKQMMGTFFGFFFMIFYSGLLVEHFPINTAGIVTLILGTAVFMFMLQVLSLLIYSFANGHPKRITSVKAITYTLLGITVLTALAVFAQNGGTQEAIYSAIASPYLEYIPIAGWMKGAVFAIIAGDGGRALIFSVLVAATFITNIILFVKTDTDYYEDVLENAEKRFEIMRSAKEKRVYSSNDYKPRKIGKTGIGKGSGAKTFFYKHLCETRHRRRFVFFSKSTLVLLAVNLIAFFIAQSIVRADGDALSAGEIMLIGTGISIYILFFMNAAGDWSRELTKPYIYLVPAPPFQKLIWACMTSIIKPAVDGAAVFAVTCAVTRADPLMGLLCAMLYASFGFLYTAGNVLSQRVFGSMANRGAALLFYMFMIIALIAPGAVLSALLYYMYGYLPEIIIGLPAVLWNVLVSAVIFYACRNILSTAEID